MPLSYCILGESKATIKTLKNILSKLPELDFMGGMCNYKHGLHILLKLKPELVFIDLDVYSQEKIALHYQEFKAQVKEASIYYIALSMDPTQAYWALKNQFYDYFLKPLQETEIHKSLLRLVTQERPSSGQTLCLKSYKEYTLLPFETILFLKADNNGADISLVNGKIVSVYKTLKSFEKTLPKNFVRIHYSYIVNKNHLFKINFGRSKCFLNHLKTALPISDSFRHNLDSFERFLEKMATTFH